MDANIRIIQKKFAEIDANRGIRSLGRPVRALLISSLLAATGAFAAPGDDAVLSAAEAFRTRDVARLARAVPQARGHALEQYVDYWQLRATLDEASAEHVRNFHSKYPNSLLSDRLRGDWLRLLAMREQWDAFQAEYAPIVNEDAELTCFALAGRYKRGDQSALGEARSVWLSPRDLPAACAPLVDALIQTGSIKAADIWQRARLLTDLGYANATKRVLNYLPEKESPDDKHIDQAFYQPLRVFDKHKLDFTKRRDRELYVMAMTRLARKDLDAASAQLLSADKAAQKRLPPEDRAYVVGQLAASAARNHLPEAVQWYGESDRISLTDEQLAWRVRAALRELNWAEVKKAVERMPPAQRNDSTWAYWLGRAQRELGQANDAHASFARIAGEHHFYGKLAAEEVGAALIVPPRGYTPTDDDLKLAAAHPSLLRAIALYRLDMRSDGLKEWNWGLRGMEDRQLLAAAELARRNELYDRAINTADRTIGIHDFAMRFLAPFRPAFSAQAKALNLEEPFVLGLVRQESRFIPGVRSSAGASGLMQLMPATARSVAKRVGIKDFRWADVVNVDLNVQLGTSYLRQVLDELDGHALLASAAYNAGPGRAQRWRASKPIEGAIYAETIPFNETRDYVKKVFSNTVYYAAVLGGDPRPLKARLGVIPPRGGERVAATTE